MRSILATIVAIGCSQFLFCVACRKAEPHVLTVAAAANLTEAFEQVGPAFTRQTGIHVVFSYASTAQLAQQIENAAPFDVFAAADLEHVDQLIREGKLLPQSRAIYARGRLALWVPRDSKARIEKLRDLSATSVRFVSIAQPEAAPYGAAAVETLRNAGIWDSVQPKVVYASNINMSKQFAATGNADAAFTAYALVRNEPGRVILIDEKLHRPIDQALGIVSASLRQADAWRFVSYLTTGEGRAILERYGYQLPRNEPTRSHP
jgi:molybdate transport system substrate-binding protein